MKTLKIGSIEIPARSSLDLEQTYEPLGGETILRTLSGAGIKQATWQKTRTVISGGGWIPPGLAHLRQRQHGFAAQGQFGPGFERMAVDDLEVELQRCRRQRRSQLIPPTPSAQPAEAGRMQVTTQTAQLLQQTLGRLESEADALHVHHRLGEAGCHQHVAPVVHVGEFMGWRRPAQLAVQLAQLGQRVRPQAGEHQESVHRQRLVPLRNERLRIGRHVQHHIGPKQVGRARRRLPDSDAAAGPA